MKFQGSDQYVATQDLMLAVNAAVTLQRPLLVKGEPGTGKTMLAEEVARALGPVSYTHLRAHETVLDLVCRLLLEKTKHTIMSSHVLRSYHLY